MTPIPDNVEAVIAELPFDEQQIVRAAQAEAEAAEQERLVKLRDLCGRLSTKRDEAIIAKRPIEEEMIRARRLIAGMDFINDTKAQPNSNTRDRGAPVVKLVATRIDRLNARLDEMLFPTQENAWDIEPDGDPEPRMDPATGQPVPIEALKAEAERKATAMKDLIADQLNQCNFSRVGRRMNHDASHIGTGLIMGPMNTLVEKRKFSNGTMALEVISTPTPEMREADPWCFFPDPVDRADRAEFAFYVFLMGQLEVRNLANTPGFDESQIKELLKTKPDLGQLQVNLAKRASELGRREALDGKYPIWRYTGVLEADDLKVLKLCECEDGEEIETPDIAMCDIWYSGEFILSAKIAPIPNDFRIPYYVFAPLSRDDSMCGYPLAVRCEGTYRAANAAFQGMLVNAAVSSAPMLIMVKGKIEPADGVHQVRGPKIFHATEPMSGESLDSYIKVLNIPANTEQAMQVMDRCINLMDEELNTSQWADASTNEDIQTAAGLAMTLNVRSIIQSKWAASADDEIFRPIIERMLWWNLNSDEPAAVALRGNYVVKPLVQSVRLIKDAQAQRLLQAMQMSGSDPRFAGMNDDYDMYVAWLKLCDAPTTFVVDKETWQANKQNTPDPNGELLSAQTALVQAQTALATSKAQTDAQGLQIKQMQAQQQAANDSATQQLNVAKFQQAGDMHYQTIGVQHERNATQIEVAHIREEAELLREQGRNDQAAFLEANAQRIEQQAIDARLAEKGMDTQMAATEIAFKQNTGQPGI